MDTKTLRVPSHLHDRAEAMLALGIDTSAIAELSAMASVASPDLLRAAIVHGLAAIEKISMESMEIRRQVPRGWSELFHLEEPAPSRALEMIPSLHGPGSWDAVLRPGERIRSLILHPEEGFDPSSLIEVRLLRQDEEMTLVSIESGVPALYYRAQDAPPLLPPHSCHDALLPVRVRITPAPPWRTPPRIELIVESVAPESPGCGAMWLGAEAGLPTGTTPSSGMELRPTPDMAPSLFEQLARASFSGQVWDIEHREDGAFLVQPHDPECPNCLRLS